MKAAQLNRRQYLGKIGHVPEFERIDVEYVTDDILMACVYFDVSERGFDGSAWRLAHLVEVVAKEFDKRIPPSFAAFVLAFRTARSLIEARPFERRKETADLSNLPPFLGGSSDPPRE